MPRPKKDGAPEPKKRSRTGCWPCKARKVKCGEEKPKCLNCEKQGEACDYSIRLNWGGRTKNKTDAGFIHSDSQSRQDLPSTIVFPTPEALTGRAVSASTSPYCPTFPNKSPGPAVRHARSHSNLSLPASEPLLIDPDLSKLGHSHSRSQNSIDKGLLSSSPSDVRPLTLPPGPKISVSAAIPRTLITLASSDGPRPFAFRSSAEYLSPSMTSHASPNHSGDIGLQVHDLHATMLPPFRPIASLSPRSRIHMAGEESPSLLGHRSKRMRLEAHGEASPLPGSPSHFDALLLSADNKSSVGDVRSPILIPYSSFGGTPLTPGSSVASEEHAWRNSARSSSTIPIHQAAQPQRDPPDPRRLSVNSLLADPNDDYKPYRSSHRHYPITSNAECTTTYGYDMGYSDLDTPRNDDAGAIMVFSPPVSRGNNEALPRANDDGGFSSVFGHGARPRDMAFEPGGYYSTPVAIKIPQALEPLPRTLLDNHMNLLYFHHFLNHTARILVPHDCEQNPFRMILPEMAIHDENLLNLLLAYSASHRARLLHQPEPANRIALWVTDVFPKLRHALIGDQPITISSLATAIMLASLEILSPNAFEVKIHWRDHLSLARQMIIARGGAQSNVCQDKVSWFLSRWFAYLDVMGSLSGRKNDKPLDSSYWVTDGLDGEGEFQIDCLSGFTTRCVKILARVAELAKDCESDRLDANDNVRESWRPSPHVVVQAEQLKHDLREAREHVYKPCPYRSPTDSESEVGWDSLEMIATNDMFHWTGLIHLDRRVLNFPIDHQEVQEGVREIVGGLYKIRPGSTTEANILFPLFTAGCHALDMAQREKIMSRLTVVETFGMTHMGKAARLMQKVWDTGKPWESLVSDEFVG